MQKRITYIIVTTLSLLLALRLQAAENLLPVRLRIAGRDILTTPPSVTDGKETFAPLEVLAAVGATGKVGNNSIAQITFSGAEKPQDIPVVQINGHSMLPLSRLASLLNASLQKLDIVGTDGQPVKEGAVATVYLLARVTGASFEEGKFRIVTSFPVPTTINRGNGDLLGVVECFGAIVGNDFKAAALPDSAGARIRAEQGGQEIARILIEAVPNGSGTVPLPTPSIPQTPTLPMPARPRTPKDQEEARRATLNMESFLQRVEANYPKLLGADAERRSATAKRLEKQGAFDPTFSIGTLHQQYNSSSTRGKRSYFVGNEFDVEFLTPYGMKIAAGGRLNLGSVKSPSSSTGSTGEYYLEFKIPLLRGAGINEKLAGERQARLGEPLATQNFLQTRFEVLQKAATEYWEWIAAGRRLQIQRDLVEVARVRAQGIRDRANAGDLPAIDAREAEGQVQQRQGALAKALQDLQKAAFKVSLYLWDQNGAAAPLPSLPEILPIPQPLASEAIQLARELALERRPELKALAINRDIARVSLSLARNQRLPAVDLVYSPGNDTGYKGVGETFKAGIAIEIPLQTRSADGRIQDAQLKLEKIAQDERFTRQSLVNEVNTAAVNVNQTYARYLAAEQELELARIVEQGERTRLAQGDSTLFLVNQREQATALAAIKVIDLQAEFQQALAAFRAASGQL